MLPFALGTVIGGVDCTESAAAAGDTYDTGQILLTEGLATVLAGAFGGVIQTTPYIGHPAYKAMGGRAAYTLAVALVVGGAGWFGGFAAFFHLLPPAVVFPILVFIGLEIAAQSYAALPKAHYPAVAMAVLPALAAVMLIGIDPILVTKPVLTEKAALTVQTLRVLANGFVITGLLWASFLAELLDGRAQRAALYLGVAAVCSLFGLMHSPFDPARIDWPWTVAADMFKDAPQAAWFQTPWHWSAAYLLAAGVVLGLNWLQPFKAHPEPHGVVTEPSESSRSQDS
jgi:AGZA family xanthine/uracil permease-like MFS transporter